MYVATLAKFKDIEYSVVEGARIFRVDLKKTGTTAQTVTLSIQFVEGTAMSKELLYHSDSYIVGNDMENILLVTICTTAKVLLLENLGKLSFGFFKFPFLSFIKN